MNMKHFASAAVLGLLLTGCGSELTALSPSPLSLPMNNTAASARCEALSQTSLSDVVITSTTWIAEGDTVAGARYYQQTAGPEISGLPAFCRVQGSIHPEAGSDIRFEVWLPTDQWDGRFHGVGVGGFAGSIDYLNLAAALKAGQASAATDTGHQGSYSESAWAKGHPQKVRDYGWRAVHLTTVNAKKLLTEFYGREEEYAYFVGCSGGGRQGLIEASRFPDDYDGIIAGAPAADFTNLVISMSHAIQAQAKSGAQIRSDQVQLIQSEIIRQCDTLDGQKDGLVQDPRVCHPNLEALACANNSSSMCFTEPQLSALAAIYQGARNSQGDAIARTFLPAGSEAGTPFPSLGWDGYLLYNGQQRPMIDPLANGLLQDLAQKPFATAQTFNFDTDGEKLKQQLSDDLDVDPDLSRFYARGGKLILWHGWADATIPPEATLDFYQNLIKTSGARAQAATQIYMPAGVQHCMGGLGADSFGQLSAPPKGASAKENLAAALHKWVEQAEKPQALVALKGSVGLMGLPASAPERQRLLCPYPQVDQLKQGQDPDLASSYHCVDPKH